MSNLVSRQAQRNKAALAAPTGTTLVSAPAGSLAAVMAAQNISGCSTADSIGALAALKQALHNDMNAEVNIRLIGDSITWGMIASGNSATDPRAHALADPRDNLTSKSWANQFRDYLGKSFATSALIAGAAGAGSYTKPVKLSFEDDRLVSKAKSGAAGGKIFNVNAGHVYGTAIDIAGAADRGGIEFDFTGSQFTLIYVTVPGYASYELFIDGVSQGLFSTDAAVAFNVQHTHTFAHGNHHIRIENSSATALLRLSGLTWTKAISVANDGIIGTYTGEWLSSGALLPNSVQATDDFVFVMLGTNDRASVVAPLTTAKTSRNIKAIVGYLTGLGKKVVLMAANSVTQDESADYYRQIDVAAAITRAADDLNIDFIDHYRLTDMYRQGGLSFLSDGLHPNDVGHALIAKNIINAIERAPATTVAVEYATTDQIVKTQILTIPVAAVATGKSYQTLTVVWGVIPSTIVGVMLRAKTAAGAYGAYTFTQDAGDNSVTDGAFPTTSGGATGSVTSLTAWVMRLFPQSGPNCRLGFVNNTGAATDAVVELTVAYIA